MVEFIAGGHQRQESFGAVSDVVFASISSHVGDEVVGVADQYVNHQVDDQGANE